MHVTYLTCRAAIRVTLSTGGAAITRLQRAWPNTTAPWRLRLLQRPLQSEYNVLRLGYKVPLDLQPYHGTSELGAADASVQQQRDGSYILLARLPPGPTRGNVSGVRGA